MSYLLFLVGCRMLAWDRDALVPTERRLKTERQDERMQNSAGDSLNWGGGIFCILWAQSLDKITKSKWQHAFLWMLLGEWAFKSLSLEVSKGIPCCSLIAYQAGPDQGPGILDLYLYPEHTSKELNPKKPFKMVPAPLDDRLENWGTEKLKTLLNTTKLMSVEDNWPYEWDMYFEPSEYRALLFQNSILLKIRICQFVLFISFQVDVYLLRSPAEVHHLNQIHVLHMPCLKGLCSSETMWI